jgi:hypothetical protein
VAARSISTLELIFQGILLLGVAFFVWQCMTDGITKLSYLLRRNHTTVNATQVNVYEDDEVHERSGYVSEQVAERMQHFDREASKRSLGP